MRTDGHDEANSGFSQFYECAYKITNSNMFRAVLARHQGVQYFGLVRIEKLLEKFRCRILIADRIVHSTYSC